MISLSGIDLELDPHGLKDHIVEPSVGGDNTLVHQEFSALREIQGSSTNVGDPSTCFLDDD